MAQFPISNRPRAATLRTTRRTALAAGFTALVTSGMPAWAKSSNFFASNDLPIGAQLYTLGDNVEKDLHGSFDRLAEIGFRSVQLSGLHGHNVSDLRKAADLSGLKITSIHLGDTDLGSSADDAMRLADDLAVLGTREVVMRMFIFPRDVARKPDEPFRGWLDRAVREQGAGLWQRTAALLNARGELLREAGVALSYHNHNCEFAPVGDTTGWGILMQETEPDFVSFEVDVGWVAAAGLDPVNFITSMAGRTRLMHVKDISAQTQPNFGFEQVSAAIGSGIIDWAALLPAAYQAGVRQFYVEQEPPFEGGRFEALAKGYAFLAR
ncbi:sugar phosphate isomerase/epimerase family protein [Croceicoccus gelatinilyticus]|uniref:sugar phosphate isomerase/epimerase family protein n=1 Tax=Croceicoccus gelatinilyticus TaxID=2835536 RepID=UPI001BCAA6E4|nr:sugar phosphate isomerase/epimerase [Croceicoccus gelatinilyticus]MBS7671178.1 sugar phosphate isomerase/epimerase [Croceicoccus gelatinilyticus]